MKKKLSAAALATNLAAGEYWDLAHPGLHLRVGANRRTWLYRYRIGGKQKRERLGYHLGNDAVNGMGLAEAREAAAAIDKRVDAGVPVASIPAVHPRSPDTLTLGKLIDNYETMRRKEGHRIKRLDEALRTVRRGLHDYLRLPARDFSKADLRAARDKINEGNSHMGNRLLGYTSPILKWAASEDMIEVNFAGAIRRAAEKKRERVLTRAELKAVWHASYALGEGQHARNFGRMVRFLVATAQRVGEAASMRHGDLLGGIWKQSDNKAGREHRLKLPALALDQIGNGVAADLIFPGEIGTKIGAVSKLKADIDKASGVKDWRLHDIRRTAASLMQEIGVSETAIRAVLNHAIPGVGQVYLRGELDRQKAEALATWADELGRIVGARRAAS